MPGRPESADPLRVLVVADFNAANFAACLAHDDEAPALAVDTSTYAHLASGRDPAGGDVAVVWTRPEVISDAFAAAVERGAADDQDVLADVDRLADRLRALAARSTQLIVIGWMPPALDAAFGSLSMREGVGLGHLVMRMNLRLAEHIARMPGALMLDPRAWRPIERASEDAKLWYAAKVPYGIEVFRRAARQVKSSIRAARGGPRKLVVLDLDDTLWGGLVGEVGWTGLRLGGHDAIGEAYADFQRTLKALRHRGVLLALASKNAEPVALEAIDHHPEMALRRHDFAAWRIDWNDKAANIAAIAAELNLGLESAVFIDDSAIERARVRETLPEVLVPEWPRNPLLYVDALLGLGCFDAVALTEEDRIRAAMYTEERRRRDERGELSMDEWLRRLDLTIEVEPFNERNAPRAVQLLNKTNQMNLTTRRLAYAELASWLADPRRRLWTFRVSDRFGDAGLTGLASVELGDRIARLTDFVLSCRVFGRRVEDVMLHVAAEWARQAGATELVAEFRPTARNAPCLAFLQRSAATRRTDHAFVWRLEQELPVPPDIVIRTEQVLA